MTSSRNGSPTKTGIQPGDGTDVDLGDDLIDGTASIPGKTQTNGLLDSQILRAPKNHAEIEDQLESARILLDEGMPEEAKRVLRCILIADEHCVVARKRLDEIHEMELKQIFSEDIHACLGRKSVQEPLSCDTESVLRSLDADLKLDLFEPSCELSILAEQLEAQLHDASSDDRVELGIAFMEMEMHELAKRQFQAAIHDPRQMLRATGLLAQCLIKSGNPFDAILRIEPILNDVDIQTEDKIDFLYLMGRANEALKNGADAARWYQRVREIDPYYRDASERLRAVLREPAPKG